jgi:hypothetical protein
VKVYLSLIEAALSGHTDAAWAQERTEAQTRGPENAQFPRNWSYGSYVEIITFPLKSYRLKN